VTIRTCLVRLCRVAVDRCSYSVWRRRSRSAVLGLTKAIKEALFFQATASDMGGAARCSTIPGASSIRRTKGHQIDGANQS